MNVEELGKKVEFLEKRLRTLEDIEEIKQLQKAYGYYSDNHMGDEAADLFADKDAYFEDGVHGGAIFLGKDRIKEIIRKFFREGQPEAMKVLTLRMQLQGLIYVSDDGNTATGRWQMLSFQTLPLAEEPNVPRSIILSGVYENEYVKENGKWKIKKLFFNTTFSCTLEDGFAEKAFLLFGSAKNPEEYVKSLKPDRTGGYGDRTYASGYRVPLSFKNPVTGK